ncbi:hypothetical protein DL93DRAFT_1954162 [Clavulina sp. PMI_390]|nr:hypothetical protein DL93DRAFT_1954162 [Clavulina sp. PMI_390]
MDMDFNSAIQFRDLIDEVDTYLDESPDAERRVHTILFRAEAVKIQRALTNDKPLCEQAELARLLRNQALALHKHSRNLEACEMDEEALAIRRECFRIHPGIERPHLASMLHTYSVHLFYEQRWTEALDTCEEAVVLRRLLYEFDPDDHQEALANSLYNLGARRNKMGKFREAKEVEEEGLVLWRLIFEKDVRYHRSLVLALDNYITSLNDCGEGVEEEYRRAIGERDALWAKLRENDIEPQPDNNRPCAHRCGKQPTGEPGAPPEYPRIPYDGPSPALLAKLNELNEDENVTDEKTKERVKEALELVPQIAISSDTFLPAPLCGRATKFRDLIDWIDTYLDDADRKEDVLLFRAEAVRIQRTLSSCAPLNLRMDLARLLRNQALTLHYYGRDDEACVLDEEALLIRRECYKAHPGQERSLLASLLQTYSIHLTGVKRYEDACAAGEEAVTLRRILYALDPDEYIIGLADSLQALGGRMSSVQRFADAAAVEDEGLTLRRILYEKDPDMHRSSLIQCLSNYIVSLEDLGLPKERNAARAELMKVRSEAPAEQQ